MLTPLQWIARVKGNDELEHLIDDDSIVFEQLLTYMFWYGEYVAKKMNEK